MKSKFLFLSTIVSSCICAMTATASDLNVQTVGCGGQNAAVNQPANAPSANSAVTNSNMPTSNGNKRACYPASKCNGDPNLIGGNTDANAAPAANAPKVLTIDSAEKFTGTVQSINRVALPDQTQIQLVLTTDQGDVLVILGPASYIDQQKIKFVAGDKVVVTGYRVTANGTSVINAASVQKNGNSLQLLDDKRQPLWGK